MFEDKGWSTIAAFQTRNPMHRSHEYLAKIAIETMDGVLIHQILGKLKEGDIPADVRADAIDTLMEKYFVKDSSIQCGYPMEMRYAGPREALLHALFRQNFGCSHLIVGRDHAGVGDYYGPFDAQKIFDDIPKGALETQPLKIDHTFYCFKCDGMASMRTCPHRRKTGSCCPAPSSGRCFPRARTFPIISAAPKCSRSSRSTMPASPRKWRSSCTATRKARIRKKYKPKVNNCKCSSFQSKG